MNRARTMLVAVLSLGAITLALGLWTDAMPQSTALAHHRPGHGGGGPPPPPSPTPPPPAGLDGGSLYYWGSYSSTDRRMYVMSPDGSNDQQVIGAPMDYDAPMPGQGAIGVPSKARHDGDRWYLSHSFTNADIIFPGSSEAHALELDVMREGELNISSTSTLASTSTRENCIQVYGRVRWAPDATGTPDRAISWAGGQWLDTLPGDPVGACETFDKAGIFRADLIYTGDVITGISAPVLDTEVPAHASGFTPDIKHFAWSPDRSSVAYIRDNGLWVGASGSLPASHTQLYAGGFFDMDWSPDQDPGTAGLQTTIAFTGWEYQGKISGGVWGVHPDGSGLELLAEATQAKNQNQTSHIHHSPFWSPGGQQLAFVDNESQSVAGPSTRSVRRMDLDGGNNVMIQTESPSLDINKLRGWSIEDLSP